MKVICNEILEFLLYIIYWVLGGQKDKCSLKFFDLVSITPKYIYLLPLFSKMAPFGPNATLPLILALIFISQESNVHRRVTGD